MPTFWVTWEETNVVGTHVEADDAEEAERIVRVRGLGGQLVEWVCDNSFQVEER